MSSGGKDGVDGVALGAMEVVAFEKPVGLEVSDHRFDGAAPSAFAADGWRGDATGVGDVHFCPLAPELVATIAAIDVGAADLAPGNTNSQ